MWKAASDISQSSAASDSSSTASDVLIRASRISRPEGASGPGGTGEPGIYIARDMETDSLFSGGLYSALHSGAQLSHGTPLHSGVPLSPKPSDVRTVHVSVKRLREVPAPLPDLDFCASNSSNVPPALPANKHPVSSEAPDPLNLLLIKEKSCQKDALPLKDCVTKHIQDDSSERAATKTTRQESSKWNHRDVEISQFASGQKESFLTTLTKRTQTAAASKEVKVKLLEDVKTTEKMTSACDVKATRSATDCATTIAAATAAAIASAIPLLKVHTDMEARMDSVSQLLNNLQKTERQLQRLTEQQSKMQTYPLDIHYPERVTELERRLSRLTEQRLQHLEKLQEQQSSLIGCAAQDCPHQNKRSGPACANVPAEPPTHPPLHQPAKTLSKNNTSTQASCDTPPVVEDKKQSGKSPLETPAPRRFAPVPISMSAPDAHHKISGEKENQENTARVEHINPVQQDHYDGSTSSYRTSNKGGTAVTYRHPGNHCSFTPPTPDPVSSTKSLYGRTCPAVESAVQRASEVLHDLGTLKWEMRCMMQEAKPWRPPVDGLKSSIPAFSSVQENPWPVLRKAAPPPRSLCEDAERILKEVQNNKKVLEDNLDAIIRGEGGTAMYSLISALTTDSNRAEKIRIQKAVGHWITEIGLQIQDELKKETVKKLADHKVHEAALRKGESHTGDSKNMKALAKSTSKAGVKVSPLSPAKSQHQQSCERLPGKLHKKVFSQALLKKDERLKESSVLNEEVLDQIYGKPMYQGHRSTMRKAPYLRFNSPSPKSKAQRPKVVEIVRGIRLKSATVQTSSSECRTSIVKSKLRVLEAPEEYEPQYVFNPSQDAENVNTLLQGHLIPLAIPLGRTRSGGKAPIPSSVLLMQPQPTVVSVSVPASSPKAPAKSRKPNIAVVEMRSEKRDPPKLTIEVLPCVDIDSIVSDSTSARQSSPDPDGSSTLPPCVPAQPNIQLPPGVESEEEILAFPGVPYIQVTDLVQDNEGDGETTEPVLELNGCAEANPPHYRGIPFPPPVPSPRAPTDVLEGIIRRKETLENRLVDWVEQEIMAKIISEMHLVRVGSLPDIPLSSSESPSSAASDIVEAAGGEGLQLFVDAGVPVDSGLIRRLVDEALADMVAVMLGDRAAHRAPPRTEADYQVTIPLVPTPQDTPPASPPPSSRETCLVKTPPVSPETSIAEPLSQIEDADHVGMTRSSVHTPPITPPSSTPRVATPPVSERHEDQVDSPITSLYNPWSHQELPLEEENPHSLREVVQYKDAIIMTVSKEEELESLVSVPSTEPENVSLTPPRRPPSLSSPSSEASTQQSSLTVTLTETESLDRPISEGEIFYSHGQITAARALVEEGMVIPNLTESLSSTLWETNDMEYDPPSEGQVIPRTLRGAYRDPILLALANLNQDPVAPQAALYHPEGSDDEDSVGEISEGQRPCLTTAAEQVLMGRSAYMERHSNTAATSTIQREHPSSPGLCQGGPEPRHAASDNSSGPMSLRELDSRIPFTRYEESVTSHHGQQEENSVWQAHAWSAVEPGPVQTRIIHVGVKASNEQGTQEDLDQTLIEPSIYVNLQSPGTILEASKKVCLTIPSVTEAASEDMKAALVESDLSDADNF